VDFVAADGMLRVERLLGGVLSIAWFGCVGVSVDHVRERCAADSGSVLQCVNEASLVWCAAEAQHGGAEGRRRDERLRTELTVLRCPSSRCLFVGPFLSHFVRLRIGRLLARSRQRMLAFGTTLQPKV
jgi:hypothetical protein